MSWVISSKSIDYWLICNINTEMIEGSFGSIVIVSQPARWLSENGSMHITYETVRHGRSCGLEIRTTSAYSPTSNGMAEEFVNTFKRDYVRLPYLASADRVHEHLRGWSEDYNEKAPRSLKIEKLKTDRRETSNQAI